MVGNFPGIFKSRMKGIDGGYKLSELLFGRGGSADAIVNVAAIEFNTKLPAINYLLYSPTDAAPQFL